MKLYELLTQVICDYRTENALVISVVFETAPEPGQSVVRIFDSRVAGVFEMFPFLEKRVIDFKDSQDSSGRVLEVCVEM